MLVVCRVQQITTLINIYKCKSAFIIAKERHTSIFFYSMNVTYLNFCLYTLIAFWFALTKWQQRWEGILKHDDVCTVARHSLRGQHTYFSYSYLPVTVFETAEYCALCTLFRTERYLPMQIMIRIVWLLAIKSEIIGRVSQAAQYVWFFAV